MGRRSSFGRREADYYPTPFAVVPPLIPHLRGVQTFAEPCAGEGDLVRHLEEFGLACVYSGDICSGQDAFALSHYSGADVGITNPPLSRETCKPYTCGLLHDLIEHFLSIAPTWLLIHFDWSATRQAAKYLPHCSDIVVLPRLKWIRDSMHTGKDSHAWFRFDRQHGSGPVLHNDRGKAQHVGSRPSDSRTMRNGRSDVRRLMNVKIDSSESAE